MNFIENVKSVKAGTIANVLYESEKKTPAKVGLGTITKRTEVRVQMRYSYENAVNNHIERNGGERDFKALSLPWGQWVEGCENLLIEHKGNYYLRMYLFSKSEPKTMLLNSEGQPLSADEAKRYWEWENGLSKGSERQSEKGLSDEYQVKPFAPNVENIISFTCGAINYSKAGAELAKAV